MKNISSPGSTAFFKPVFAWVLLGLIGTSSLRAQTPLNDSNFFTARDLWFSDQASAIATYGHIKDWNVTGVTNMSQAFKDKSTFDENITGWDVSNVTSMFGMFWGAASFNQPIGNWNTAQVTNMTHMFHSAYAFNESIGNWNTAQVTNMAHMFESAENFNQDIGDWNTSKVTNMTGMFYAYQKTTVFNQDLGRWDTGKVLSMDRMFRKTTVFDQDISKWDVSSATNFNDIFLNATALSNAHKGLIHSSFSSNSNWNTDWSAHVPAPASLTNANFQTAVDLWCSDKTAAFATYGHIKDWNVTGVTDMTEAFRDKTSFDENISAWDVSNVTDMNHMFTDASAFNQPIGDWNVSKVTNMRCMFQGASSFNQTIGNWNTSSVTDMGWMFRWAYVFNQPIGNWNVSAVLQISGMFHAASNFNQPIGNWDVSSVKYMSSMFHNAQSFNQPIGDWNTSAVTGLNSMFNAASNFNQPIGNWDVSAVTSMDAMFYNAQSFNQPIGDWNTSAVTGLNSMFERASSFNQDLGSWDTSTVTDMRDVFNSATSFNQDLSDWNVSAVTNMIMPLANTPALSDSNKGLIHGTFSKNPNWPYDWSAYHTRPAHVVPSAANLRMLWVQPGSFTMGSPVTEAGREAFKEQEHNVTLTQGFYLGKYEVTQAQYETVMTGNSDGLSPTPSQFGGNPNRPVEKVSWNDAQVFLARLNALEAANLPAGWTYVLPTEAQWEYACRAGTTTAYSWGTTMTAENANWNHGGDLNQTVDIGQFSANKWGFFDMHGNVWEWTADRYQTAYPTGNPVIDPIGPASGWNRVRRGGGWGGDEAALRSARRNSYPPNELYSNGGFRLAFRQTSPPPPITNANFTTAINLWFSDEANATRTYGHIRDWNVSGVTNMAYAFKDRTTFNEDISGWDVSKVSNMRWMFAGANSFNQPIGRWKTSSVTNMKFMFSNAIAFNQPIGNWDTSSVVLMDSMFNSATAFNQPLGDWNTSAVKNMTNLFRNASAFNQPIGSWDTSSVITMDHMFNTATAFNQPIGSWNVSQVTQMGSMFKYASNFNQSIKDWDISSVTNMNGMFFSASSFDQDLSTWKFSTVAGTNAIFANTALSDANKGKIHTAFSTNSNWRYDWSAFVTNAPPFPTADINQTDHRLDNNSTLFPPLPKTLTREELKTGQIRLWGQILANGGSPVTETAFEVADNLVFRNSTLHPASMLASSPNFYASLTLEPGKRYYYRAVATNALGTTNGSPKKFTTAGSPIRWWSESIPQGKDWRTSPWFGTFRPYDNGWIYHAKLGWAYAQPDGSGGLWLWMRDHRWTWTQKGVFPYLWKHQSASWHYLLGSQNGQPVFYEWRESAASTQP